MPSSGRDDQIVQRALARVLAYVFSQGGEALVLRTLKAEGKTPGDAADLWTMCRLLKIVGELIIVLFYPREVSEIRTSSAPANACCSPTKKVVIIRREHRN